VAHTVSNYDDFALIYNRHWGPRYAANALETLETLVLSRIPTGGRILDLCCRAGQVSRILTDRGFDVVGLDASPALVGIARKNAPNGHFEVADAKSFSSSDRFQAAISLNDSLNHLLRIEDLRSTFLSVYKCLVPGGAFLFDVNLAHKYQTSWAGSFSIVEEDAVCAVVATTDMEQRQQDSMPRCFCQPRDYGPVRTSGCCRLGIHPMTCAPPWLRSGLLMFVSRIERVPSL